MFSPSVVVFLPSCSLPMPAYDGCYQGWSGCHALGLRFSWYSSVHVDQRFPSLFGYRTLPGLTYTHGRHKGHISKEIENYFRTEAFQRGMLKLMNEFLVYFFPVKLSHHEQPSHAVSHHYPFTHFRRRSIIGWHSRRLRGNEVRPSK